MIIPFLIATLIPLFVLYLIYTLDLYKTGSFPFVLLSFAAGLVAFWIAKQVNSYFYMNGYVNYDNAVRYMAPVVEEILKALVLIYLVRRPNFTYFVDGAIYGFAVGIGFAVIENYDYILYTPEAGLVTAIGRVISSNLMHAASSALVGVALGYSRFEKSFRRVLFFLLGIAGAMALHILFNNVVNRVEGGLRLVYAAVIGLSAAGLIAWIIQLGLKEEKVWIEEKLGEADRVTKGEAAVVQQLGEISDVLAPLVQRFGQEKADQIEKFITIQARLGILRKTLDKLNDEKMKASVEKQMADLRQQMDHARREVGSYAMLYLRHTIPAEASPLWGRLETLIQERIATRPETGGLNAWANLDQRVGQLQAKPPLEAADEPGAQETASPQPAEKPKPGGLPWGIPAQKKPGDQDKLDKKEISP